MRINLTDQDIARIRLTNGPDPMAEAVGCLRLLRSARRHSARDPWQARVRGPARRAARLLLPLVPEQGPFAAFLVPGLDATDPERHLAAVRTTSDDRVRVALSDLAPGGRRQDWVQALRNGGPEGSSVLSGLTSALRVYYGTVVEPELPAIRLAVQTDRTARARDLLEGGVQKLLAGLAPHVRWLSPTTLQVSCSQPGELLAGGHGIRFVPSYFWPSCLVLRPAASGGLTVLYPVRERVRSSEPEPNGDRTGTLAALLGRTRARVLIALRVPGTTTELAGRLGVSLATASQHATVLREAGLLDTHRRGSAVLHVLTDLGRRLSEGTHPFVRSGPE